MVNDNMKIWGITISLSWIGLVVSLIFLKSLGVVYNDFFNQYSKSILIFSGIAFLFLVTVGVISVSSIKNKVN